MRFVISPRDSSDKLTLEHVSCVYQGGDSFVVHFDDGRVRYYPMQHIWYIEKVM